MSAEHSSDVKFEIGHVLFIDIVGYAKFYSRSHDAVIRVCDAVGNVIETREHAGDFRDW